MRHPLRSIVLFCVLALCLPAGWADAAGPDTTPAQAASGSPAGKTAGQTLYVPCYSHIYHGIKTMPIDLTITLSVRNTDPKRSITVTLVEYYDTAGKPIRSYLTAPAKLGPLMTAEYIVGQTDSKGGSGANFLVRWTADQPACPPLAEAVMIGTSSQQGISFTSRGFPIGSD